MADSESDTCICELIVQTPLDAARTRIKVSWKSFTMGHEVLYLPSAAKPVVVAEPCLMSMTSSAQREPQGNFWAFSSSTSENCVLEVFLAGPGF